MIRQWRAAQSITKVEGRGIYLQDINTNKSPNLKETEINNCFVTEFFFVTNFIKRELSARCFTAVYYFEEITTSPSLIRAGPRLFLLLLNIALLN